MNVTIRILLLTCLALTPALALDEYLPVATRIMQIDLGGARSSINGQYLDDWSDNGVENSNNPLAMPLQGKFGLSDGLEGSMQVNYIFQDSGGHTGLDRPVLALKYADSATGAGGFAAITLPIGFEDILDAGNFATFTFGPMVGHRWADFGLLANASYNFTTEDKNNSKKDFVDVFVKPGYFVPIPAMRKHHQDLELNLGMEYTFWFNESVEGISVDQTDQLFSIQPGFLYTFNRIFSAEVKSHFTLSGQNQPSTNGVELKLFFTLDEAIYNAISG